MKKKSKNYFDDKRIFIPAAVLAIAGAGYLGYSAGKIAERFYAIATLEERLLPEGESPLGRFTGMNPMQYGQYESPAGGDGYQGQGRGPGGYASR